MATFKKKPNIIMQTKRGQTKKKSKIQSKKHKPMEKKKMICDFFHSHHKPNPNTSIPCDPPLAVSDSDMNSDEIKQAFGDACCEIECIPDNEALAELPCNIDAIRPEADDMSDMTQ